MDKVAVIGAGFTGISAGYYLIKKGYQVTIFEKEKTPGGLAMGFKNDSWSWPIEKHYHHLFVSDTEIINFAKEVGVKINFYKSKTSIFSRGSFYPLDSPASILKFPYLDIVSKIKMGISLGYLKLAPNWKNLEKITAKNYILKSMGTKPWRIIWQPLLEGKFGKYAETIPASWFWARIKKRSVYLGYPEGGFENFVKKATLAFEKMGGKIIYGQGVTPSSPELSGFNNIISTIPAGKLAYLGAINLILRFNKPFLPDKVYWLNIGGLDFSFLSVVEHTNLFPKENYGGEHIVYVGKYLPPNHKYFSMTKEEILDEYHKDLVKLNPNYKSALIGSDVFKAPYAQPIFPRNYSETIDPIKTNDEKVYRATMEQVYPWDRGTNYAVEMGKNVAEIVDQQK